MNQLFYLYDPVSIPGSDIVIVALTRDGAPYGILKSRFIGDELADTEEAFSLIPYFTRISMQEDDVPDLDDLMNSVTAAFIRGKAIYGKTFFT